MTLSLSDLRTRLHNRRSAVILGLIGLAGIHILDLPAKFEETPYLAWAYIGIILFSVVVIERLTVKGSVLDYLGAAGASLAVFAGYVINRTVGMPGAMGDIGNWWEPLGLLSLFIELFAVWHSVAGYLTLLRIRRLESATA
ncbi:MAG: hypothetical protein RLZ72_542 [Actinomycetota bacterium]|jgi:hypothetical protein